MPEEKRLLAELEGCDRERHLTRSALDHPQHSILNDGYQLLTKAAEIAETKVDAVRVRLRSLRTAKLRKKDSDHLHQLRKGLTGFAEEIDAITYTDEAAKEQTPSPESISAYQKRFQRLETIRGKLAKLTLVMESVQ
jgi:hypothetical protein